MIRRSGASLNEQTRGLRRRVQPSLNVQVRAPALPRVGYDHRCAVPLASCPCRVLHPRAPPTCRSLAAAARRSLASQLPTHQPRAVLPRAAPATPVPRLPTTHVPQKPPDAGALPRPPRPLAPRRSHSPGSRRAPPSRRRCGAARRTVRVRSGAPTPQLVRPWTSGPALGPNPAP